MVAIHEFYANAAIFTCRFEVEDLARHIGQSRNGRSCCCRNRSQPSRQNRRRFLENCRRFGAEWKSTWRRHIRSAPHLHTFDFKLGPAKCNRRCKSLRTSSSGRFRFYAVFDRIFRIDVLESAMERVRDNKGAPGPRQGSRFLPAHMEVTYHEPMPFVRSTVSSSGNTIGLRALHKFLLLTVLPLVNMCASEPQSLDRTLEPYLKQFGLPAMAAA